MFCQICFDFADADMNFAINMAESGRTKRQVVLVLSGTRIISYTMIDDNAYEEKDEND